MIVGDELADELVQAALENLLHSAVLDPCADGAGLPLRRSLAAIGASDVIEVLHHITVAARERARHLVLEDEQVRDQPGLHALPINPMVGGERRDRAQDRRPLEIVEWAADALVRRQQQVIFHVEDARGVVGALEDAALFLDLKDPESLAINLLKIIESQDCVDVLKANGKKRAESWREEDTWFSLKEIFDEYAIKLKCWR